MAREHETEAQQFVACGCVPLCGSVLIVTFKSSLAAATCVTFSSLGALCIVLQNMNFAMLLLIFLSRKFI